MKTTEPQIRGVAMVMALALIGIVAVVLSVVAVRTNLLLQRTFNAAEEAQASQLLVAGTETARRQFTSGKKQDGLIPAPVGEITLTWAGDKCMVDVRLPRLARSLELDSKSLAR